MERFNEILANIKSELQELEEINVEKSREIEALKQQLNMCSKVDCQKLSIEEVFEHFYLKKSPSQKFKAFNRLKLMGIHYVSDFPKIEVTKLLNTHESSYISTAIILVLMEHYGIGINMLADDKVVSQLKEKVAKIKAEIEFI